MTVDDDPVAGDNYIFCPPFVFVFFLYFFSLHVVFAVPLIYCTS